MYVVCPSTLHLNPASTPVDDLDLALFVNDVVHIPLVQMLSLDGIDQVWAPGLFFLPDYDCILIGRYQLPVNCSACGVSRQAMMHDA